MLAKYFIKQHLEENMNFKGKICLELGCGTGVLSIVLACLGRIIFNILFFFLINLIGATVYCTDLPELKEVV